MELKPTKSKRYPARLVASDWTEYVLYKEASRRHVQPGHEVIRLVEIIDKKTQRIDTTPRGIRASGAKLSRTKQGLEKIAGDVNIAEVRARAGQMATQISEFLAERPELASAEGAPDRLATLDKWCGVGMYITIGGAANLDITFFNMYNWPIAAREVMGAIGTALIYHGVDVIRDKPATEPEDS